MAKIGIKIPNGERLELRYSVWSGVLKGYLGKERVVEIAPSAKKVTPDGKIMGRSYGELLKDVGCCAKDAKEGTVSFNVGEHLVEIESQLVEVEGVLKIPLQWIGYAQCEIIIRLDGKQVLKHYFF